MYSLDNSSYCSALMLAALGAPDVGSVGVGCGFSDSGERPLGAFEVVENARILGIERIRGACCEVWRKVRSRGAEVRVRCLSEWEAARASFGMDVRDMAMTEGRSELRFVSGWILLYYMVLLWIGRKANLSSVKHSILELPHNLARNSQHEFSQPLGLYHP